MIIRKNEEEEKNSVKVAVPWPQSTKVLRVFD